MKIVAMTANVAQLLIILSIFFIRGIDLGALVIVLLFMLLAVPFINFLAIFFANRPMLESASNEIERNGMIKREAMRVRYHEDRCPVLTIGGIAFAVRDLSEGGVRIHASRSTPFKRKVNGQIQLIGGDRIQFKATMLRREGGEVIFQFTNPIGTGLLLEEKKAMTADTEG